MVCNLSKSEIMNIKFVAVFKKAYRNSVHKCFISRNECHNGSCFSSLSE